MTQAHVMTQALAPLRWAWWMVALFSGLSNLLMLVPTLYMLQVYDRVLVGRNELTLLFVSLLMVALLVFMSLFEAMRSRLLVRLGVALDRRLSPEVFDAALHAAARASAERARRALSDLLELRQFLTGHGVIAFLDLPWSVVFVVVLFVLHPWLGALALLFALAQASLAWWGHRRSKGLWDQASDAQFAAQRMLRDQLSQAPAVHPMGMATTLQAHWREAHDHALAHHGRAQALTHGLTAWSKWLRYTQQSLSLAAGAWLVIRGEVTVGAMIAANVLMTRALSPIDQVVGLYRQGLGAQAAYRRLVALLVDAEQPVPQPLADPGQATLALKGLQAHAPDGRVIVQAVDWQVTPGSMTAVLGPSGCGKSTLLRAMLGIWPWVSGKVSVNGEVVGGLSAALGGARVGYLPQAVELFDGTIAENIARMGEVDAEAVIRAAQAAGLHEWVLRQAQGYDTPIGESGQLLSGGQRQRIGLARALYGDPLWLVLDEPNAHLDEAGEQALNQTLRAALERGQQVLVVSHRPGVLALATHVLLMQDGRMVWSGPKTQAQAMLASDGVNYGG